MARPARHRTYPNSPRAGQPARVLWFILNNRRRRADDGGGGELGEFTILTEDEQPLLAEDGQPLITEDAP